MSWEMARRALSGTSLCRNTVHIYAPNIEQWFEEGKEDKGKTWVNRWCGRPKTQLSSAVRNPNRAAFKKCDKQVGILILEKPWFWWYENTGGNGETRGIYCLYLTEISQIVKKYPKVRRRMVSGMPIEHLDLHEDDLPAIIPSEKQLRAKVSY